MDGENNHATLKKRFINTPLLFQASILVWINYDTILDEVSSLVTSEASGAKRELI